MDHLKKPIVLFGFTGLPPGLQIDQTQITYQLSVEPSVFFLTNNPTTSNRQVWAMTKKNEYILPETNISPENGWLED